LVWFAAWALYAVSAAFLWPQFLWNGTVLLILPVLLGSWLFGMWRGAVLALTVDAATLLAVASSIGWEPALQAQLPRIIWTPVMAVGAAAFGRLRDVGLRLRKEITKASEYERKLEESNRELERKSRELGRRASELEQALAELERSNSDLEQLAYVASHDLKEPLRMVSSFTALIQKKLPSDRDPKIDQYMHYVVDGASRMGRLIDGLLEYGRVGMQARVLMPVDLNAASGTAISNLQATIQDAAAHVHIERLPTVSADESQMERLFQNLIGNAVKFRGKAPAVVRVSARRNGEMWQIEVADNGIGFEQEFAGRIFQIFQRLHPRAEYEGTGIGLAMCKRIVEAHGGKIWARSAAGKGAAFYFTLPAWPGEAREEEDRGS
jgi:light-regulated signal transduction histidine kinase (bacteriophytochrome)